MGACSVGKDSIVNELKNKYGYEVCISCSTRPKRTKEIDGKDYYFISDSEFLQKLNNNELLEMREYSTISGLWWYGLSKKAVDTNKNQLVILDAKGYKTVVEALGQENVLGIYIYTTQREQIIRALNREPNREDNEFYMELFRRITDDMTAFNDVKNDDKIYKVQNKNGEFNNTIKNILNIINNFTDRKRETNE